MKTMEPQKVPFDAPAEPSGSRELEVLYRRYGAWLSTALRRRFGPSIVPIVEDLVQETYTRLAPDQAARGIRHPKAFLMQVASNIARDQLRRDKLGFRAAIATGAPELSADPHGNTEQSTALQLKAVVLALPPKYREVFVLSRFGGLTYDQIAHHCGVSVKTVEWRMTKALAICAQWLRD